LSALPPVVVSDDDDVDRAGADQHVHDLERLLAGVRLGHEQRVGVDAELLGVVGVEGVLGVDERRDAALPLRVRDGVQRDGRLAGGLRAVDLDDAALGQAADAERDVERDGAGGDHLDGGTPVVAEAHDRALAELAVDLAECGLEGLLAVLGSGHVTPRRSRAASRCAYGGWSLMSCSDAMPDHRHAPRGRPQPAPAASPVDDPRAATVRTARHRHPL
jgi:hypothetical protein